MYNMPALNQEVVPPYLAVQTDTVLDERKDTIDEVITRFSLLSEIDVNFPHNSTVVIKPREAFPNKLDAVPFLSIVALTAAGLDQKCVMEAYDVGEDRRHLRVIEALYRNMGLTGLSNTDPELWPRALSIINGAYSKKLLQIDKPLKIVSDPRSTYMARSYSQVIQSSSGVTLPEANRQTMVSLATRFGVYPLATLALSKTAEWKATRGGRAPSVLPEKHSYIPELVSTVQRDGVPAQVKIHDATFTYHPISSLTDIQNESLAMTGFGLSQNNMSEASARYQEQEVSPRIVLEDLAKNHVGLSHRDRISEVSLATSLFRDGHISIDPNHDLLPPQLPDTPLHKAIMALVPSGMNHKKMFDAITRSIPGFEAVTERDYEKAKAELFKAANVGGLRDFNILLFARGFVDQQDLHDIDLRNPDGNVPRLRRKLGLA
jgi:hypothetical protein